MATLFYSPFDKVPLQLQANFMNEQKRLLSPLEVDEMDRLCRESSESATGRCCKLPQPQVGDTSHALPRFLIMFPATSKAAAELIVSLFTLNPSRGTGFRFPLKLLLCSCSVIVPHTSTTTDVQVTDDQANTMAQNPHPLHSLLIVVLDPW
ncbi:hypothetical protein Pelo_3988 [Pelomyxa schiedti]|nr:hypothetical protein Pelo_3988 [Pelomyxa schiedti]